MNVRSQISILHTQTELIDPRPYYSLRKESGMLPSNPSVRDSAVSSRGYSKLRARMQFTIDEDQVLVLRRLLVNTAGLYLKDIRITAIKSKHVAKIAIDIESSMVDHIFYTVIHTMQSVELGQISLL